MKFKIIFASSLVFMVFEPSLSVQTPITTTLLGNIKLNYHNHASTYEDALASCKNEDSTLILVKNKWVKTALKSLLISRNLNVSGPWSETVWTRVVQNCSAKTTSTTSRILQVSFNNSEKAFAFNNSTKNFSSVNSIWLNSNQTQKYSFVCQKELKNCSESKSCDAQKGINSNAFGFNICYCKGGAKRGVDGVCPADPEDAQVSCEKTTVRNYTFNRTDVNEVARSLETCESDKNASIATITCLRVNATYARFEFSTLHLPECNASLEILEDEVLNNVTQQNFENKTSSLQYLTARKSTLTNNETEKAAEILQILSKYVTSKNIEVSEESFSHVARSVSKLNPEKLSVESKSETVSATMAIISNVPVKNETITFQTKNILAQIVTIESKDKSKVLTLPEPNKALSVKPQVNIKLNVQALGEKNKNATLQLVIYKSNFLPYHKGSSEPIVSLKVRGTNEFKLKEPISINYASKNTEHGRPKQAQASNNNMVIQQVNEIVKQCAYWNFEKKAWAHDGLTLDLKTEKFPVCKTTHLTNFALLVSTHAANSDVVLNIFSKLGCYVTVVCLFIAIVLYLANRKMRVRLSAQIQIHIFINLFFAYCLFLFGVDKTKPVFPCQIITTILHYFFLTSFSWTAVFSNSVYISIVKVFHKISGNYIWKGCLFAYGAPLLCVGGNVLLALMVLDQKKKDYASNKSPSKYFSENMCWVRTPSLYISFLLLVGLVILHNLVVVIIISKKVLFKKKEIRSSQTKKSGVKKVGVVLSLSVTLGLTWFVAYLLMIDPDPIYQKIMAWIFVFSTCFQGLLLFILSCVKNQEMFDFWYLPLRKIFCHPKSSRIEDSSVSNTLTNQQSKTFTLRSEGKGSNKQFENNASHSTFM